VRCCFSQMRCKDRENIVGFTRLRRKKNENFYCLEGEEKVKIRFSKVCMKLLIGVRKGRKKIKGE